MNGGRIISPASTFAFAVAAFVALVVALFPIYPRRVEINVGETASRTIKAPRSFTFVSERLTEQQKEEAARAVPDVLAYDASVRSAQLAKLDAALAAATRIRNDDAPQAAKLTALADVNDLGGLTAEAATALLDLSDEDWQATAAEARRVLDETLASPLDAGTVGTARNTIASRLPPDAGAETALVLVEILRPLVVSTMVVDESATEAAREEARRAVVPAQVSYAEGQTIVEANQVITAEMVEALEEAGLLSGRFRAGAVFGVIVISAVAAASLSLYLLFLQPAGVAGNRQLLLLALTLAAPLLLARVYFSLVLPDEERHFLAFALPIAAAPMAIAALLETGVAVVVAGLLGALVALTAVFLPDLSLVVAVDALDALRLMLVYGFSALAGVYMMNRAERLQRYLSAALVVAGVSFAVLLSTWFVDTERESNDLAWMAAVSAVNGVGSGFLAAGAFVTVGFLFGITTRVQLMELSQLNSPLLRRLQAEAPGTFHHSVVVGNLAERAADLVGADPLLTRVGCYYHDVGKVLQPGFYIENQLGGDNPHDDLPPDESAVRIVEHITNGLELARKHHLPERVRQFIPEHHGTRLVTYFYRKAAAERPDVDAEIFRYAGPKPQSRETAIVMLADACEAYVRSSPDRSAEAIDRLVDQAIGERVSEGQLDECDLTFRDVRTIGESFKATLRGVYHPRIEYPEPTEAERRLAGRRFFASSSQRAADADGRKGQPRTVSH